MRAEKTLLLNEIKDKIDQSGSFFVLRHKGINPNLAASFRQDVLKAGGEYEVVKKRLFLKAAEQAGIEIKADHLEGHIGVVFASSDPVQTTKTIVDFGKSNEGLLDVLAGHFEGQVCTASDVKAIAELPSKDEMRAQLLSVFEAPLSQTLSVMEALLTSVMHCLENKTKKE